MTDKKTVDIRSRLKNNSKIMDALQEKRKQAKIQENEAIIELFQDYVYFKKANEDIQVDSVKTLIKNFIEKKSINNSIKNIFRKNISQFVWGIKPRQDTVDNILNSVKNKTDLYFIEDAFLRCIVTCANKLPESMHKYQISCGYIFDDLTPYYDGTRASRMEKVLNSDFIVTTEQQARARKLINKIIESKISKYNNQPIYKPNIGRQDVKKILVVDQSYGDYSIVKGCADDTTFKMMLDCAIKENPNADILIKTHPDAMGESSNEQKCYYQYTKEENNIYKVTEPINPISMIEYCDKVYVCSSQFGFEALMCGKEVHTFGMPFYANWGLTIDAQKCSRRTRTRTLEELFYIAYIYMAQYVNPKTGKPCEIEEAIDYLIEMRTQYNTEVGKL